MNKMIQFEIKTELVLLIFPLASDSIWLSIGSAATRLLYLNVAVADLACLGVWKGTGLMSLAWPITRLRLRAH